jgi:hypothetical protein
MSDSEYEYAAQISPPEVKPVVTERPKRGRKKKVPVATTLAEENVAEPEEEIIRIRQFDPSTMPPFSNHPDETGVKIVVIGKPGTGKSTLIASLCASKTHLIPVAQIFSGTEDSNHFYSSKFPPVCVYNKLDLEAMKGFIQRQKWAKEHLKNPWALQIIDDCTDDPAQLRLPIFQAYYKNGRHWKMMHILSLQYCLDIRPSIRSNIDYTFILRETNLKNRESLYKNYASCIPNFQMFQEIMDVITEDYTALVINNRVQSNKIEDCIFWYRAQKDGIPANWRFGAASAWDFSNERNDPEWNELVI